MKINTHYIPNYLLNPTHPVTVEIIGAGGTGSQVVSCLARMNHALKKLDHPGLQVRLWDGDQVAEPNIGRQLFSEHDIGRYKSTVLIERLNLFFATDWEAEAKNYEGDTARPGNIIISCVDTWQARAVIHKALKPYKKGAKNEHEQCYYWMDFGNGKNYAQCVLGTIYEVGKDGTPSLPNFIEKFQSYSKSKASKNEPSCSLAEALEKQDLFINSTIAQLGTNMLWRLFREMKISYHGLFLNLETMNVNPIKILS